MTLFRRKSQDLNQIGLTSFFQPNSTSTEQYLTLRTNLQFAFDDAQESHTLVVTSPNSNEGKSTVAVNLALVCAQAGQRVLLVDGDIRRPTVWQTFKLANRQGLSNALAENDGVQAYIQKLQIPNLDVLTSGTQIASVSELLNSKRLANLIAQVKAQYELIIFDMPPINTVTDAAVVSAQTDGAILVARSHVTLKNELLKAKEALELAHAKILGVVYNDINQTDRDDDYYYGNNE
ncbi:CpsD/CapB family tyrosine-protein kinase [Bombilactobacillus folatiphilus]|uniref:Tyrosine-protein kinase CpsD n=1 Tax=Bombilactobacillus folatiphilus TaxID=2923362 RepID=A0ABY4P872_9LACO|nr:CpsD/CapB family tyrosine-protein kinase [Bombilactobacillus folatiphilus]UQS81721.1 CpsD/CapB family tyrosine-protein kinase [Bombilactobacillus folatiphilus]